MVFISTSSYLLLASTKRTFTFKLDQARAENSMGISGLALNSVTVSPSPTVYNNSQCKLNDETFSRDVVSTVESLGLHTIR